MDPGFFAIRTFSLAVCSLIMYVTRFVSVCKRPIQLLEDGGNLPNASRDNITLPLVRPEEVKHCALNSDMLFNSCL